MDPKDPPQVDTPVTQAAADERRRKIAEICAEEERRLRACFDAPDFADRVDAMMNAGGRLKKRPIAGSF